MQWLLQLPLLILASAGGGLLGSGFNLLKRKALLWRQRRPSLLWRLVEGATVALVTAGTITLLPAAVGTCLQAGSCCLGSVLLSWPPGAGPADSTLTLPYHSRVAAQRVPFHVALPLPTCRPSRSCPRHGSLRMWCAMAAPPASTTTSQQGCRAALVRAEGGSHRGWLQTLQTAGPSLGVRQCALLTSRDTPRACPLSSVGHSQPAQPGQ